MSALDRGRVLVGDDGPTHHGVFDLSYLRHIPEMVCMAPRDEGDLRRMLATALSLDGPSSLRYPRGSGPRRGLDVPLVPVEVGRAELLRDGGDVAILAVGPLVDAALEAADLLAARRMHAAVVNARFVRPLDADLIASLASRCRAFVTVEENTMVGGFGAGVLELLAARGLNVPVRVLGLPDAFVPHGDRSALLAEVGLDAAGIADAAVRIHSQVPGAQIPAGGK